MQVEYYKEDVQFISELLKWSPIKNIIKKLEKGVSSPECDEFMLCELTEKELNELVGFLNLEANNNESKKTARRASDIADYFES